MADEVEELVDETMPETPEDEDEPVEGEEPAEEEAPEEEPTEEDGLTWKQRFEAMQQKLGQQSLELGQLRKLREEMEARQQAPAAKPEEPKGETYVIADKPRSMADIAAVKAEADAAYRRHYKPLVDNGLMDANEAGLLAYEEAFTERDRIETLRREYEPLKQTAAMSKMSGLARDILAEVSDAPAEEFQALLSTWDPVMVASADPEYVREIARVAAESLAYRRLKAAKVAPQPPAAKAPRTASASSAPAVSGDQQARMAALKRDVPGLTEDQYKKYAKEGGW